MGCVQLHAQPPCPAPASAQRPPEPADESFLSPSVPGQEGSIPSCGKSRGLGTARAWQSPTPCLPKGRRTRPAPPGAVGEDPAWGQWVTWLGGLGVLQTASHTPNSPSSHIPRSWTTLGCSAPQWDPSETCWQPEGLCLMPGGLSGCVSPPHPPKPGNGSRVTHKKGQKTRWYPKTSQ